MAAQNVSFSAAIDSWVKQTDARMTAIFRSSAQEVSLRVTGYLSGDLVNVQTGFLRASQVASTESMPPIKKGSKPKEGATYSLNSGQISLVIAGAEIGQTIYLGWTAEYGPYLEYGTSTIAPRGFVRLAAAQWQEIVRIQTVRAKNVALDGFAVLSE
jgi:hypothetical protein